MEACEEVMYDWEAEEADEDDDEAEGGGNRGGGAVGTIKYRATKSGYGAMRHSTC